MRDIPHSRPLSALGYFPDPLFVKHRVSRNLMASSAFADLSPAAILTRLPGILAATEQQAAVWCVCLAEAGGGGPKSRRARLRDHARKSVSYFQNGSS
jgi:hypothetical protein